MSTFGSSFDSALNPVLHGTNSGGGYGSTGRLQFTPHEDRLLALGLYERGVCVRCSVLLGDDYSMIARELLVTKSEKQLRNRSKNQRNNHRQNMIRQYYAMLTEFVKWDPSVYYQICTTMVTHTVTWQTLQRLYFYFYNDVTLKYYWLNSYFHIVKKMRETRATQTVPFFLTMPHMETIEVPVMHTPREEGTRGRAGGG